MKVLHQAGHNTIWNIESYRDDKIGDGIIFSPVHYSKQNLLTVPEEIRAQSLFDPQYYVPDSQKQKLHSYEFFPEKISNGFSTSDFVTTADESAEMCLQFQEEAGFSGIIIPVRYLDQMHPDYIERQKTFSVEPFLNKLEKLELNKDIFLSLPLTIEMIADESFKKKILNWVTQYPTLYGIYLMVSFGEQSKQIGDYRKLSLYLDFSKELQETGLNVIHGYCNTEGILYTLTDPYAVTIGAYENTRSFSIDKFLYDETDKRGPAPRIFLPKLLNWVRFDTAVEIREDHPKLWQKIYSATEHAESVFKTGQKPHFTQSPLYKHHFKLMQTEFMGVSDLSIEDRIKLLKEKVQQAISFYQEIKSAGVVFFDKNCEGEHLPAWNRYLNKLSA